MKKKRILQVVPALETGGLERVTIQTTKQLIALAGQNNRFFVASSGGRLAGELGQNHICIPNLHRRTPWHIMRNIFSLMRVIKKHKISLVHARSRAPAWSCYFACKLLRLPFMTSFHGVYNQTNSLKALYNSIMVRGVYVIAISEFVARHIRKTFAHLNPRIACIPAGIDVHHFDPERVSTADIDAFYANHNIQRFRKILFLPGRLTALKGHHVLLEAAKSLNPDVFAVVIAGDHQGRKGYAETLKKKASKLTMPVIFVTKLDDLVVAYAAADIVFSCSTDPEAFGRITTEALAMGRPYIGTNHGGSLEQTRNGLYGVLVPPHDPQALVHAVNAFERMSPDKRAQYSRNVRKHIVENYAEERMAQMTLRVYADVLS
ncbi:MAG: glycosyltransferase family 4 protein [Alphaproteobacteria bacterium]|nr:MAG: glycosyltransferase family 4 protein [Alphaproteobacteria bacterium]